MTKEIPVRLKVVASKRVQKEVEEELKQKNKSIASVLEEEKKEEDKNEAS